MDKISGLPDELLVKILTNVPTKVVVSTSIFSKRWECFWKWVPKLECDCSTPALRDFIENNLPVRAPIMESLHLRFRYASFQIPDVKPWVEIAASCCLRELSIEGKSRPRIRSANVLLPRSLYTCKSLVTLKLEGPDILLDVPPTGCLPSLKSLQLQSVTYSKEDSLLLLLSYCHVLEELIIERYENDNIKEIVVTIPSLQRLSLKIDSSCSSDDYVIHTPSLKYFKIEDQSESFSYSILHMPNLEEADISITQDIKMLFESITSVKRLSLRILFYLEQDQSVYRAGIVFNQLEHLKLCICNDYWSILLVFLLKNSPQLRVLNLFVDIYPLFENYETIRYWKKKRSTVQEWSVETFEFAGYMGSQEEKDFLSFFFKNASCLKSSLITHHVPQDHKRNLR